ncbi:hypothetical protein SLS62_001855 [Diatrype stigma]|uniref:Uncharacterized protein n=1 Tax=Diatrype stigma TaxID=117547 RepID=A0AAN9YVT5_9PEZI
MYFTSILASTLLAVASAATIQRQQQAPNIAARDFNGGTCTFEMEQFKAADQDLGHFAGQSLDGAGEHVGSFDLEFDGGGYPVVIRSFPEFFLLVKEDHDDLAPIQYQYLAQKWTSDDAEQCTQTEYSGQSRNISCTFEC